jgi:hypothetical protein
MSKMRGLELVAIGKTRFFEIFYQWDENLKKNVYKNLKGDVLENLLDMSCYACGAAYYALEDDPIAFCPNCGHFEREKFETLPDLITGIRGQNWDFLKFSGNSVFAVKKNDIWQVAFAKNENELMLEGRYSDIQKL